MEARSKTEDQLVVDLHKVFRAVPDAITITRLRDGKIVEVNDAFSEMSGYSRDEVLGRCSIDLGLWADPKNREKAIGILRDQGRIRDLEIVTRTKSGSLVDCHYSAEVIVVQGEEHILSVAHDISRRKQFEQELMRIRAAVDGASDAIGMATPEGSHFYQNRAFSELLGYAVEDLKGPRAILKPFTNPDTVGQLFDAVEKGLSWSGEAEMIAKDGRRLPVYVRADAIRDDQGTITSLIGMMTDLTKLTEFELSLKNRNAALLESQERFAKLFGATQDCIFIKDTQFRFLEVNQATSDFTGISRNEFVGKSDKDVFGEQFYLRTRDIESRVLQDQVVETQESLVWNSQPTHWSVIRFPLKDPAGKITGVCGVARELDYHRLSSIYEDLQSENGDAVSPAMAETRTKADIAAETAATILLTGETGAGKDHLARYIHEKSSKRLGPYLSINCAAIPAELAESELFGHEAGAFTGAQRRKRGLLELAEGGTLLLNEIGELSLILQAKLLTFLDTFSFTRVGGEKLVTVSVRLIAATSKNLENEITEGRFRKELFYRLNVFPIEIPPLRERKEDIPGLAREILSEIAYANGAPHTPAFEARVVDTLVDYRWPGNVRELKNILERALILSKGGAIKAQHLGLGGAQTGESSGEPSSLASTPSFHELVGATERTLIEEALARTKGNKQRAARELKMSRYMLLRRLKKLGIV